VEVQDQGEGETRGKSHLTTLGSDFIVPAPRPETGFYEQSLQYHQSAPHKRLDDSSAWSGEKKGRHRPARDQSGAADILAEPEEETALGD
jgi:hypothetical protein